MKDLFTNIYHNNTFGGVESRSGHGSNLANTAAIRAALPALVARLGVRTLLDIPCGDFYWMKEVDLRGIMYLGADIVGALIERNRQLFSAGNINFLKLDITDDELPPADLILCRDCLVHFSNADALRAIANIKRSGAGYLLTTTFTNREANQDIATGEWRALNLEAPPFNFPPPLEVINEGYMGQGGAWADMSQGLWKIADLPGG